MLAALDTNILVYAEGVNGLPQAEKATALWQRLPAVSVWLPAPVLCELYSVLTRRGGRSRAEGHSAALIWQRTFSVLPLSVPAMRAGMDLAAAHQLQIWDAVILAVTAEAGGSLLLSEDLQHGFNWEGVTVVNPFAYPEHPLLMQLFD